MCCFTSYLTYPLSLQFFGWAHWPARKILQALKTNAHNIAPATYSPSGVGSQTPVAIDEMLFGSHRFQHNLISSVIVLLFFQGHPSTIQAARHVLPSLNHFVLPMY